MSTKTQNPDLTKANEPGHWGTTGTEPKKDKDQDKTVKEKEGASSSHSYQKAPAHGGEVTHESKGDYKNPGGTEVSGNKGKSNPDSFEPKTYPEKAQLYDEKQPKKSGVVDVPVPNETTPGKTERPNKAGEVGTERPESPGRNL